MAVKTPSTPEEQDKAYNPGELQAAEKFPETYATHDIDQAEAFANDEKNNTGNIDDTKESEQTGGWTNKYTGSKQRVVAKTFLKRKGPAGVIITIVTGGGLGIAGLLSPAGALIHVKEVLQEKFDSMSSVVDERSTLAMRSRIFSSVDTNATCAIKVKCRFKGLNEDEMKSLRTSGADILDSSGKPLTKSKLTGRYTGGKTLVVPNIDGTEQKIDAKGYKAAVRGNTRVASAVRTVWGSKFGIWQKSEPSVKFRAKEKLTTNPDWGNGDEKEARKAVFKAESGQSASASVTDVPPDQKYQTEKDKNGNTVIKKDPNGNPIPLDPTQTNIPNFGGATDNINKVAGEYGALAAAGDGDKIPLLPTDPGGAAALSPTAVSSPGVFKSALGFLNPASFLVGMCTTYKLTNALVMTAKTIALANAMRYASLFLSTADKIKAGDGTSNDVNQAMTILEREDAYGDAFGDAVGYQYPTYGTVPDKPIASSATGNAVIHVLSAAIVWINHTLGKKNVKKACGIISNPIVQGGLALTSFIPGGGGVIKGLTSAVTMGAKKIAEDGIKAAVKKIVDEQVKKAAGKFTKDALKDAARSATKTFIKMAAGAGGIFLASYIIDRYAIPYLGRVLSGAELNGSEDGVLSIDTIGNGFDATNQGTGLSYGMVPLKKDEVAAFQQFNQSSKDEYVAEMRAQSNPFDLTDPHSASNSLASSLFMFSSKLKGSSLLSAPARILSALNPTPLISSTVGAVPVNDAGSCDDQYLNDQNMATTPFCNVIVGYNDVNMLQNTTPEAVVDWMYNNNQIDDNGDPVTDSNYAKFETECGPDSGGKVITELDPGDNSASDTVLPENCYGDKNKTTEWKYFHLYDIDTNTGNAMDSKPVVDTSSNVKYIAVGNIPIGGMDVGASVYGGKQVGGGLWAANWADNGGNDNGNGQASACNSKNPHLTGTVSFAELDMGKALGNIPDCTKLEIKFNGSNKTIIATKQDIGGGGGDVQGHKRAVDLWWEAANALGFNVGTGVVTIHAVDPATPDTPVATTGNSSKNIASIFNFNPFSSFIGGAK